MITKTVFLLSLLAAIVVAFLPSVDGFLVGTPFVNSSPIQKKKNLLIVPAGGSGNSNSGDTATTKTSTTTSTTTLSPPEQKVYNVLQEMHNSQYPFRLVVVGNGAILETTSVLGPTMKVGTSPRTGEPLVTLASSDQSFEFHLMLAQVSKITMTEKESPTATGGERMQVSRFLTDEGKPMCSLILADKGPDAQAWFETMMKKYDNGDIQL